jgi:hypothetical protein
VKVWWPVQNFNLQMRVKTRSVCIPFDNNEYDILNQSEKRRKKERPLQDIGLDVRWVLLCLRNNVEIFAKSFLRTRNNRVRRCVIEKILFLVEYYMNNIHKNPVRF